MRYDDKSPDPMLWSSARVSKWLREYKGGKYAVLLQDDYFKSMDGEAVCTLPAAGVPGIARSVLFAYMFTQQAFQQLSACTHGEQSCLCILVLYYAWCGVAAGLRTRVRLPRHHVRVERPGTGCGAGGGGMICRWCQVVAMQGVT